jgi:hypothetical protein
MQFISCEITTTQRKSFAFCDKSFENFRFECVLFAPLSWSESQTSY